MIFKCGSEHRVTTLQWVGLYHSHCSLSTDKTLTLFLGGTAILVVIAGKRKTVILQPKQLSEALCIMQLALAGATVSAPLFGSLRLKRRDCFVIEALAGEKRG